MFAFGYELNRRTLMVLLMDLSSVGEESFYRVCAGCILTWLVVRRWQSGSGTRESQTSIPPAHLTQIEVSTESSSWAGTRGSWVPRELSGGDMLIVELVGELWWNSIQAASCVLQDEGLLADMQCRAASKSCLACSVWPMISWWNLDQSLTEAPSVWQMDFQTWEMNWGPYFGGWCGNWGHTSQSSFPISAQIYWV